MLNFTKLWILLESRGMKRTDLKKVISSVTLAKLGKNEKISSDTIEKICGFLNCQPGDIMEYISEEQIRNVAEKFDAMNKALSEQLHAQGISEEQFTSMMSQLMPEMIKSMYQGGNTFTQLYDQAIEENKKSET